MSWIDDILNAILQQSNPMGPDPTGANPVGVPGANYGAEQVIRGVPKAQFGNDKDTTNRINADIAGRPRPAEDFNGLLELLKNSSR